ncbi:MAG: type II toxin-antitoxin system HicA family toxin [Patescibacteria group bacterium]
MPKLRSLDSREMIKILKSFGFEVDSQRGSHIKLVKERNSEGDL